MKKLSNKGIGHHLLIVIVAVVAVVGAAGFFVWQRQKNNDIEAQAASTTFVAAWEAESTAIQRPDRKDKSPIIHDSGSRTTNGWKSDPKVNGRYFTMRGPKTNIGTVNCGRFCYDNSHIAYFRMKALNGRDAKVTIHLYSAKARKGQGQYITREVLVSSSKFDNYPIDFDLTKFFTAQGSSCGNWGSYRTYCVQDAEFWVAVKTGQVEIDKVTLYR